MRGERDARDKDGRRYAIRIEATDDCGNTGAPVQVGSIHVPHHQPGPLTECREPRKRPDGEPPGGGCTCRTLPHEWRPFQGIEGSFLGRIPREVSVPRLGVLPLAAAVSYVSWAYPAFATYVRDAETGTPHPRFTFWLCLGTLLAGTIAGRWASPAYPVRSSPER